ncbi:protein kinase [Stigmatella sp. ncwal1]|uniref:non-specific serine/threonine protein kinase n=1 Tax=Stigmatella ashevillensis TaxID=2995309 RepID=A0ABT5DK33_9BACT|nr:protein kinase [Stigmatella ashevillena]MDC0712726.1 protein kinase [Stigmatella ashevillena]
MSATGFGVPKGAILFEENGFQYEFREDLGEIHQGVHLLLAWRREGGRPQDKVLIKAVGPSSATTTPISRIKRARVRLEEQVRLSKFLAHPGILEVHGLKKVEGTWYVISEYPSGNSLSSLLTLVGECRRWYSPHFTMFVGARIADVLAFAHGVKGEQWQRPLKIVHRAIDADHVFLDWNGIVRVSDFGLALSTLPGRVPSTARRLQGDGFYSSPEMLLGKRVDARSDLFSLGVLMLEMSTGNNLLYAPDEVTEEVKASLNPSQLRRVMRAIQRAQLSRCSPLLEDAIWRAATYTQADVDRLTANLYEGLRITLRKLLHPMPGERYQTAGALVADLSRWLGELTFNPEDVVAELMSVMDEAGRRMAGTELQHSLGENTTA